MATESGHSSGRPKKKHVGKSGKGKSGKMKSPHWINCVQFSSEHQSDF